MTFTGTGLLDWGKVQITKPSTGHAEYEVILQHQQMLQTGSWIYKSGALRTSGLRSNLGVTGEQTVTEVMKTDEISLGQCME